MCERREGRSEVRSQKSEVRSQGSKKAPSDDRNENTVLDGVLENACRTVFSLKSRACWREERNKKDASVETRVQNGLQLELRSSGLVVVVFIFFKGMNQCLEIGPATSDVFVQLFNRQTHDL
jgi:hypothetical protein